MLNDKSNVSRQELEQIFKNARKIFFVGIGGISMSSLAEYCVYLGKEVYGYDKERNEACKKLETVAKKIKYCSTPDSASHMDLVVYSNAIDESNFEIQCAIKENLPLVSRSMLLGCITKDFRHRIGVSGMHGKSTVTSMLSAVYQEAGAEPTVFCGAVMRDIGSAYRLGTGNTVIYEACEYMNSFHNMPPTDGVILNVDYDHPDFFTSREQIVSSFRKFGSMADRVYVNADDIMSRDLNLKNSVTFGINSRADYTARGILLDGVCEFDAYYKDKFLTRMRLGSCGLHTVYNALCTLSVAIENGIGTDTVKRALSVFKGSERRLELYKKTTRGGDIYIDYAHHPKEISATLDALLHMGYKSVLCIFQAHTYSRVHFLYDQFISCFWSASKLILTDIYPAREENVYGVRESDLAKDAGGEYISDLTKVAEIIRSGEWDATVIMGAGDIVKIKKFL